MDLTMEYLKNKNGIVVQDMTNEFKKAYGFGYSESEGEELSYYWTYDKAERDMLVEVWKATGEMSLKQAFYEEEKIVRPVRVFLLKEEQFLMRKSNLERNLGYNLP